ncbi:hypothetical protein L6Q79_15290 [bacterium]|nr:hypothetical protein [bacterium]NUN46621.1 hypothetical protein [bacterium]
MKTFNLDARLFAIINSSEFEGKETTGPIMRKGEGNCVELLVFESPDQAKRFMRDQNITWEKHQIVNLSHSVIVDSVNELSDEFDVKIILVN